MAFDEWLMPKADALVQWAWDRFELHLRSIMRAIFLVWIVSDYSGRRLQNNIDWEFWFSWFWLGLYMGLVEMTFRWPAKRRNMTLIGARTGALRFVRATLILSTVFWVVAHACLPPLVRELMVTQDIASVLFIIGAATRSPQGPGGTKRWRFNWTPQLAWSAG